MSSNINSNRRSQDCRVGDPISRSQGGSAAGLKRSNKQPLAVSRNRSSNRRLSSAAVPRRSRNRQAPTAGAGSTDAVSELNRVTRSPRSTKAASVSSRISLEAIAFAAFASRNTVSKAPADCIGNVRENDRAISHRLVLVPAAALLSSNHLLCRPGLLPRKSRYNVSWRNRSPL